MARLEPAIPATLDAKAQSVLSLAGVAAGPCCFYAEAVAQTRGVRAVQDDPGMGQDFLGSDREQELLLPPSASGCRRGHLAWLVIEAVEALDLTAFCAS